MRILYLIIILNYINTTAQAQQFQIGISGNLSAYAGDLSERVFPKQGTNVAMGVSLNYEYREQVIFKAALTFAKIGGADRYSTDPVLRARNLSFETPITEFSVMGEYYFMNLYKWRFSPYVFTGLAVFHFNPYTYDALKHKVYLRPLSTEGQGIPGYRKPYHLTQIAIPFGGGIKFNINDRIRIGTELGMRKVFTNYLDDLSETYVDQKDLRNARGAQAVELAYRGDEIVGGDPNYPMKGARRGNPDVRDYYYFAGLHVTYKLRVDWRWPWMRRG